MKNVFYLLILFNVKLIYSQNFWEKINTPSKLIFTSFYSDNSGSLIAGTVGSGLGGIYKSTDEGITWELLKFFGVNSSRNLLVNSLNNYFASVDNQGIYRSSDNGKNWEMILSNNECRSIKADTKGNIYVGDGVFDLLRTSDCGNTWVNLTQGKFYSGIDGIAINSKDEIFVASYFRAYRTVDHGVNWVEVDNGLSTFEIYDVNVDNHDNLFIATLGGIYRSTDNGENWNNITYEFGIKDAICMLVYFNNIYIGTAYQGVFHSADKGNTWKSINMGLSSYPIIALGLTSSGYLLASSNGGGLYRSKNIVTYAEVIKLPNNWSLNQNYPNPFNPTTTIEYEIPNNSKVRIEVFNVLGQEVALVLNEEQMPGNYKLNFDGSKLSSGIYFYKITANNFVQTKKMILLR